MRFLRMAMAAAALTVALVIPSTASAQINTFQIGSTAQLGPEGASLTVPVTINCEAGSTGDVGLDIRQAQGKRLIDGNGFESVTCTGENQTVIVLIRNNTGSRFKQGSAAANGVLFITAPVFAVAFVDPQPIRIVK